MSFTLLAHLTNSVFGPTNTASIDTSGADIIVIYADSTPAVTLGTPTDFYGNVYTQIGYGDDAANLSGAIFWKGNPTKGAGHYFTPGDAFQDVTVGAWSGSAGSSAGDQVAGRGDNTTGNASIHSGAIVPTVNGCLIVTGMCCSYTSGLTVPTGFTATDTEAFTASSARLARGLAWQEQAVAASTDPLWAWSTQTLDEQCSTTASFKPSAGGGGGATVKQLAALGCG